MSRKILRKFQDSTVEIIMIIFETLFSEMMDEKCVMNSYFGIGIDAKITLDFHMKREEHPEKCRSRARNYMWYGVLGSKEWLQVSVRCFETDPDLISSILVSIKNRKLTRTWNNEFYSSATGLEFHCPACKASSFLISPGILFI